MARDDAEEALVVEDFEYSAAQQRYQVEAQSQRGNNDAMREELFYKDATPKAEHYISFVGHLKRCEPARRDGDPKGPSERPRLGLVLRYRIELGSYRQGDRRFVVRATIAKAARGGDASPPRPGNFLPAHTPPARASVAERRRFRPTRRAPQVYVASKVKRPRAALRDDDGDEDDDRASSSPPPPSKRAPQRRGCCPPSGRGRESPKIADVAS
ncbi:hypothetical protein JL722_11472 [Aureococcus anophagefferens]|nr:hypothetical protein JL722_11472 [Aureococcus anophagefferens]